MFGYKEHTDLVWHKARSMEHPLKIELNSNGMLAELANHYTLRDIQICLAWHKARRMTPPLRTYFHNYGLQTQFTYHCTVRSSEKRTCDTG